MVKTKIHNIYMHLKEQKKDYFLLNFWKKLNEEAIEKKGKFR